MASQWGQSPSIIVSMVLSLVRRQVSELLCENFVMTGEMTTGASGHSCFYHWFAATATMSQNLLPDFMILMAVCGWGFPGWICSAILAEVGGDG